MLNKVEIFQTGLTTQDGRGIMPGSTLYLKNEMPAGWSRFARSDDRVLVVASPAAAADARVRNELEADYVELFGKKPHHKMSTENIHKAIIEKLDAE